MKTMGLTRLRLVAPKRYPHAEAEAMAAGATDVLNTAECFTTLDEAVADCHLVLGTTARNRRADYDEYPPAHAAEIAFDRAVQGHNVAFVFGRERTGLENNELLLCNAAVYIPANPDYASLNLAAAVQVLSYEVRMAALNRMHATNQSDANTPVELANHQQLEGFYQQLEDVLTLVDFHKGRPPESAMQKMRQIFSRSGLTSKEVKLLRGALSDTRRSLKNIKPQ